MVAPHFLQTRTFLPSSTLEATRVGLPHLGHTSITLETYMGISRRTMPPSSPCLRGFTWQVATLTPSTTTFFSAGMAVSTLPSLPLSLPDRTTTLSFFLIFILSYPLRWFRAPETESS